MESATFRVDRGWWCGCVVVMIVRSVRLLFGARVDDNITDGYSYSQ